jgi:hypothetical protein
MKRCRHCERTKKNNIKCMCKQHIKLQKLKREMDKTTKKIVYWEITRGELT